MQHLREVTLDLEPRGAIPVVRAKQGDASFRFIKVTMIDNDAQVLPETGMVAVFREEKPDGTGVMLDSSLVDSTLGRRLVTINNDGTITVEMIEQTMTCAGRCMCDICLLKDGKTISTATFVLEVFRSPSTTNLEQSSTDFRTIQNALDLINDYIGGIDADDRYY